jgi:fructokinase
LQNAGSPLRIGIDLGGTKIEIAAFDEAGHTLARHRVPSPAHDYDAIVATLADLVARVERELGRRATVGIGTPGALSPATGLMKNANSTVLNGRPFAADLEAALARKIRIANDANCFALSEATDGAAAGARYVFGVIVGTGTGGGIAVGRRILAGANAIAGEWGHNPLPWLRDDERPGPPCYCGKYGCIETWLSGPGFARDHAARGGTGDARAIAAAAASGDAAARASLDRYADRMARALATVVNVLDPDAIVLGGGVSNVASLAGDVRARLPAYAFSDVLTTRVTTALHGDASGVRGAAWLWDDTRAGWSGV